MMWINQICRLCAQVSEVLFPIFDKSPDKQRLDAKIKRCLSILVTEDDPKPKQICYNCVSKLEEYSDFLDACLTSDYKFETILYTAAAEAEAEAEAAAAAEAGDACRPRWDERLSVSVVADASLGLPPDSVIVVGKLDEPAAEIAAPKDCQDILLMVELKYREAGPGPEPPPEPPPPHHDVLGLDDIAASFPEQFVDGGGGDEQQQTEERLVKAAAVTPTTVPTTTRKPFPCAQCGKSFMRRTNLNAHMSTHTQVRPFRCGECGRTFALRWNLTVHQRLHSGLYACEFCGKPFPVKGKLERHRRIHTGEKPFACAGCDKAFADKRNLEAHQRTHTQERPFACAVCARRFRSRSHLTEHGRVHSADAPYTCDACGKSFKWKTNLTIHMRNHAATDTQCPDCGRHFPKAAQLLRHRAAHRLGHRPPGHLPADCA